MPTEQRFRFERYKETSDLYFVFFLYKAKKDRGREKTEAAKMLVKI